MSNAYCPRCQSYQNMDVTNTESINKDENGKISTMLITSFHCSICHMFVKSEIMSDHNQRQNDCKKNVSIIINEPIIVKKE